LDFGFQNNNLTKRIIPCLDIKDGRTVKGVNFTGLKDAGDPIELAARYEAEGADELVFLDITATIEKRKALLSLVESISERISIPFTVGGGISSLNDAHDILRAGADKVSINSSAVKNPELVNELANAFGRQCVVVAIDTKINGGTANVYIGGGRFATNLEVSSWCQKAEELGAGEILLTSMSSDGTKAGFSIELYKKIASNITIPVIASGGAGSSQDFLNLFLQTDVSAALAASLFHFNELSIPNLKDFLLSNGIKMRIS
jgi:imidazole glycerol-phosphate synthase subunit HisF